MVLALELESDTKIGTVIIYDDGFIHINILDKVVDNQGYVNSLTFDDNANLLKILDECFSKYW